MAKVVPTAAPVARLGLAATALAVVLWGAGSTLGKYVDLPGQVVSLHRIWWAAGLYVAVLAMRGRRLNIDQVRQAAPAGVAYALTNVLFFVGVKHTTVANATIIISLQPLPLMLVSNRLFGERVSSRDIGLSLVAAVGVGLVVFGSSQTVEWSPVGDLLCVGSLLAWAVYFVATKQLRSTFTAVELQASMLPVAGVVLIGIVAVSGASFSPGGPADWLGIAALVATAGTGHLLLSWATAYIPLAQASVLTLGQPVVSIVLAAALLDEAVVAWQVVGMVVLVAALAAVVSGRQR